MKKKQILILLIAHYELAIKRIKELQTLKTAKHILTIFGVKYGICYAAYHFFKVDIVEKRWIHKYIQKNDIYWTELPCSADTTEEILSLLQIRVDIMKKEFKRKWWHLF